MVNWNDPATVAAEEFALVKFLHVLDGIFIWEYFSTIRYEWEVVTRRRPWRWTMGIYIGCRLSTLAAICCELVGFNLTTSFDCKGWLVSLLFFSFTALALASLLIVMRSIALWERRLSIVVLMLGIWLTNIGFLIYGLAVADAFFDPIASTCAITTTAKNRDNVVVTLVSDFVLCVIMLGGVVRQKNDGGLWRMIYRHGVIWIALATLSEVPPATFLILNLNDPMNLMFQTPALIVMTIGATRIYRSLQDYAGPVITASYLSDAQFATNPEFAMVERRNNKPAPFLRFDHPFPPNSNYAYSKRPPPHDHPQNPAPVFSKSKFGSVKSKASGKFGPSRFGGPRARARQRLRYPIPQSQSQSHASMSQIQSQVRSQTQTQSGGLGMDSMDVEFHKSYGRYDDADVDTPVDGPDPLNAMGTIGSIGPIGTVGTIGMDELAYAESGGGGGRRRSWQDDLEGYGDGGGFGPRERYQYQDGEEALSPITESTAYSNSTTNYSRGDEAGARGEVPGLNGGRDAFALVPAGWGGGSGNRSRRDSTASASGAGASASGGGVWGGYGLGSALGWASRSRHDREVAREVREQQQQEQERQDGHGRRSPDLESGTGNLSTTTRVGSRAGTGEAMGEEGMPPVYPMPPVSHK
ncbi:uncharacterized protein STEHIDRAFT_148503 [Stereum hirsutum FP-91666 SS1]|uniref:uncharacterized protein n=1 Tax=Stereum hirsutum (strain FP-91666) TaxID=721885 RepID=UPI0004449AF9|nr:uncharacterized protein STEHIDRAFT_148503 [Stereum hirsutum FP-91666 SS1]EIM84470.1 hypothetical protein STEHIDRAFT_148503 [Stereum hirsutum FP-91666 SS1]